MIDPQTDLEINVRSQLSILEACRKNNPDAIVIFASTRQLYGRPSYLPVDENHPLCPTDINGINKMAGEWYHTLYNRVHGIKTVSLRLTNTYGPRQLMKHNRQGFIPWFIRQIILGETVEIFGDGRQIRDLNYVDDVVSALLLVGACPEAYGQVFNLGGDPISLLDLVKLIIAENGKGHYRCVPFPPEKKKIDIGDFFADFRKIRNLLNWCPKIAHREGLRRTIKFYRDYGGHYWK